MADEPSIDEILASLDRLLNEGEGRNDEPAELFQQPSVEEPSLRFLMALDQTVPEPYNEMGPAEAEAGEAVAETAAADEPMSAASAGAVHEEATEGPRRIVLTDAMMVDDIQQPLPLAMGDTAAPADAVQKPVTPESVVAESSSTTPSPIPVASPEYDSASWEERDIQALVDQVTDDVCSAVAEQLPALIRQALAHRLSAFIDEKARNQDEKPEE